MLDCVPPGSSANEWIETLIIEAKFRTDDSQRVEAFYAKDDYGRNSRVPVKTGRYGFSYRSWKSERVLFAIGHCSNDEIVRAHVPASKVLIHLTSGNASHYQVGRQSLTAAPDRLVVLPSDHEYSLRSMPGVKFAFALDSDLLLAELQDLWPGRRGHAVIRAGDIRVSEADRDILSTLHRRFRKLAQTCPNDDGQAVRVLESHIASWCARKMLENACCQPLSPRNRMRLEHIIDWIERHLAEPISLDQLVRVSGIHARTLNNIFKASRGVAPLEFVQDRRLAAAHRMLTNSTMNTAVSEVALDCGFTHLGRFAQSYRQAFGETPSDTLNKSSQSR